MLSAHLGARSRLVTAPALPRALLSRLHANGSPQAVLAQLTTAFAEFRAHNDGRLDTVQAVLDDHAARLAALGTSTGSGPSGNLRAAGEAFGRFARTGEVEAMRTLAPRAAMSVGSDPDGGALVPREIDRWITELARNYSPMRRLARVINMGSSSIDIPINRQGTGSGWTGETAARVQTTSPSLAVLNMSAGEIYAMPAATQQIIDDAAFDVSAFLIEEIAREFGKQEGLAFLWGDGINKPLGLMQVLKSTADDSSRPFGTWQERPSGAANGVSLDGLIDLVFSLRAEYRQNASWMMNSTTMASLRKMKDTAGQYLWQPSLIAGQPSTLLGFPVEVDESMPGLAPSQSPDVFNQHPIVFGDFYRAYAIGDRIGVKITRDVYTNRPYILFYSTKRVAGLPIDSNAVRFLKVGTS